MTPKIVRKDFIFTPSQIEKALLTPPVTVTSKQFYEQNGLASVSPRMLSRTALVLNVFFLVNPQCQYTCIFASSSFMQRSTMRATNLLSEIEINQFYSEHAYQG